MSNYIYKSILHINDKTLEFMESIIDKYGKVTFLKDIENASLEKEKHHDYVFFCITKAVRSLNAAHALCLYLNNKEDTLVLVRTAYEMYLSMANSINDDVHTFKAVDVEIGL